MGKCLSIITPLHTQTTRNYLGRMTDEKVWCMGIAKQYGQEFWDGARRYGYGGYTYDGRWAPVAARLVEHYQLKGNARILDIGCGKGYLLYELGRMLPEASLTGVDISTYALHHAKEEVRHNLRKHAAQERFDYADGTFDLVISLTTLHNLKIFELAKSLPEIQRLGRASYITVESYRSDRELFNLQCWALTCAAFFQPEEWLWLFEQFGYQGDYEFIYFE